MQLNSQQTGAFWTTITESTIVHIFLKVYLFLTRSTLAKSTLIPQVWSWEFLALPWKYCLGRKFQPLLSSMRKKRKSEPGTRKSIQSNLKTCRICWYNVGDKTLSPKCFEVHLWYRSNWWSAQPHSCAMHLLAKNFASKLEAKIKANEEREIFRMHLGI